MRAQGRGGAGHAVLCASCLRPSPSPTQGVTAGGPVRRVWQHVGGAEAAPLWGTGGRTSEGREQARSSPGLGLSNVKDGAVTKWGAGRAHTVEGSEGRKGLLWNILGNDRSERTRKEVWEETGSLCV